MVKLPALILALFLLKHGNCMIIWLTDFPVVGDVTLEKGKPIHLPKNYTKVQIHGLSGTIYSDSFSQLGVSELRIFYIRDVTKIEDGALCSSPTLKILEMSFRSNNPPALRKNMFENCNKLEKLRLDYQDRNGSCEIDHNALESLSSLKYLHFEGYKLTRLKKDFLKISDTVTTLFFSYCSIQKINSDTFEYLKNLETIGIIHNKHLKKIPLGLFKNTPKLKTLTLRSNNIQDLTWNEFKGLANLEVLNVGENQIASFDADKIATNFPNLRSLYIESNPPLCKDIEVFVNQLKTKLKKLVDVKYKVDPVYCDSCEQY